jgi:hypothetical protein
VQPSARLGPELRAPQGGQQSCCGYTHSLRMLEKPDAHNLRPHSGYARALAAGLRVLAEPAAQWRRPACGHVQRWRCEPASLLPMHTLLHHAYADCTVEEPHARRTCFTHTFL